MSKILSKISQKIQCDYNGARCRITFFEEKTKDPGQHVTGIALYFYPRATLSADTSKYSRRANNPDPAREAYHAYTACAGLYVDSARPLVRGIIVIEGDVGGRRTGFFRQNNVECLCDLDENEAGMRKPSALAAGCCQINT